MSPSRLLALHPHVDLLAGLATWNALPLLSPGEAGESWVTKHLEVLPAFDSDGRLAGYPAWQFVGPYPAFSWLSLSAVRDSVVWAVAEALLEPEGALEEAPERPLNELRAWWVLPHPALGPRTRAPMEIAATAPGTAMTLLTSGRLPAAPA